MSSTAINSKKSNTRISPPAGGSSNNPGGTAKANFVAQTMGNEKGLISFGKIHKDAKCTSGVMLSTPDGEHKIYMDIDGDREGSTICTGPGAFVIETGSKMEEDDETIVITAWKGNIDLIAKKGKIRMNAIDIEMNATGNDTSNGNIQMDATENVSIVAKKFSVNTKTSYKIVSSGTGLVTANSILKCYGSILALSDDSCALKDSKCGSQRLQREANNGV